MLVAAIAKGPLSQYFMPDYKNRLNISQPFILTVFSLSASETSVKRKKKTLDKMNLSLHYTIHTTDFNLNS